MIEEKCCLPNIFGNILCVAKFLRYRALLVVIVNAKPGSSQSPIGHESR